MSARAVLPDGNVREFSGADLDVISDAEGITGFISQVTVRVQPLEELEVVSIGCPDAHDMQKLVQSMVDAQLPIWSLIFINPRMAELKNKAPLMMHNGHPAEERVLLPASYIMTLAFRKKDQAAVTGKLPELLKPCEAEILSERIAHHEWKHRFKLMVVKRLGPSLIPTEVVIPLNALGDVMTEIERKVDQPIVKEGVVIRRGANGQPEGGDLGVHPWRRAQVQLSLCFQPVAHGHPHRSKARRARVFDRAVLCEQGAPDIGPGTPQPAQGVQAAGGSQVLLTLARSSARL